MSNGKRYVIPPPPQAALAVAGSSDLFPVRRIWCVGRNYLEHIKEMGQDEREPPFFFSKPADALVPDGGTAPYPSLTKDMHHEVELVVALKSGGRNIPTEKALDCAINIAAEGVRLGDICAEIEDEAARNSFSVVREFVGHGVGRKLHEEPQIPNYGRRGSGPKLKSGMTLAIEPMINIGSAEVRLLDDGWTVRTADGTRSAHFEHTVLITKDGPEILTWRGKTQLK